MFLYFPNFSLSFSKFLLKKKKILKHRNNDSISLTSLCHIISIYHMRYLALYNYQTRIDLDKLKYQLLFFPSSVERNIISYQDKISFPLKM